MSGYGGYSMGMLQPNPSTDAGSAGGFGGDLNVPIGDPSQNPSDPNSALVAGDNGLSFYPTPGSQQAGATGGVFGGIYNPNSSANTIYNGLVGSPGIYNPNQILPSQQAAYSGQPQSSATKMFGPQGNMFGSGFSNNIGGATLGANSSSVKPLPFTGGGGSVPVQLRPLAPAPWQNYQAALAQLAYNPVYQQVMNQYAKMLGLAGANQASQQMQNQQLTGQQIGQGMQQALSGGFGNSTVLPGIINQAQNLGAQRGANIAGQTAQQQLAVHQAKAQALSTLPPPIAPGAFGTPVNPHVSPVGQEAYTLLGNYGVVTPPGVQPTLH